MSSTTTHNDKKKLSPKLRFKEFGENWELSRLIDKSDKISDGIHTTPLYDDNGEYFFINGNNLIDGEIRISENTKRIGKEQFNKYKKDLDSNSILLSINGTIGSLAIYKNEKVILGKSACYINVGKLAHTKFVYHLLQNTKTQNYFISELTGTTIKNLSLASVKNFESYYPSLPEQQKIASFLSAVDEKIQQLTRKKELLEQYKKGVMQQLFSGKLRFKDDNGKPYSKWEEKLFKDVVIDFRLGGNYSNTETVTNYPLVKMGNLDRGKIKLDKIEYIPETETIDPKDEIKYGDLFFNTRNTLDLVGKVAIWRNELPKAYYNSNLMYLKFENNFFMNYRLNSYEGVKALKRFATGTTSVAAIYTKDLMNLKLNMPSLEEQQKIASFLTALDAKIENVAAQIAHTQSFKKGLLQQMFV